MKYFPIFSKKLIIDTINEKKFIIKNKLNKFLYIQLIVIQTYLKYTYYEKFYGMLLIFEILEFFKNKNYLI